MTRKQRRFVLIGLGVGVLGVAAGLMLWALRDRVAFFYSPTEIAEKHVAPGIRIRLGGVVSPGSIVRGDPPNVRFEVTDGKKAIMVAFTDKLPDLFREGQVIVAEGALDASGVFKADIVLAKHDEAYMPKVVADALAEQSRRKQGLSSATVEPAAAEKPP